MIKAKNLKDALAHRDTIVELNLEHDSPDFPIEIYSLPHLRVLSFNSNFCTEIPDGIGKLSGLNKLVIIGKEIKKISSEITQLQQLFTVALECPKLQQLPAFSANLQQITLSKMPQIFPLDFSLYSQLFYLDINHCQLKELPQGKYFSKSLKTLQLEHNQLSELPDYICQFEQLQRLILSHNKLQKLPADFQQLGKLHTLTLYQNPFTEVPEILMNMPALRELHGSHSFSVSGFRKINADAFLADIKAGAVAPAYRYSLYKIFVGTTDIPQLPLSHLLESLRMKSEDFQQHALPELQKRAEAALAEKPLQQGSRVAVIGKKISFNKTELRKKLEDAGLSYSTKLDDKTTHILIANKLDDSELAALANRSEQPILLDKNMESFLKSQEERYLTQAPAAEAAPNIEHLSNLLLSRNASNIEIALQILKTGGVPKELLTELFLVLKDTSLSDKLRKSARQLFDLNASEAAKAQASDKTAWYAMKDRVSMSLPLKVYFRDCELDRKKIALHLQSVIGVGYWVWFELISPDERRTEMKRLLADPDYIPYFYDEWRTYTSDDHRDLVPLRSSVKRMSFQKDGRCHYSNVVLNYPNLEYLDFSCSAERSLPDYIAKLSKLKVLNIVNCRNFSQFPDFLLEMPNLHTILVRGTDFGGNLPPESVFDRSELPEKLIRK